MVKGLIGKKIEMSQTFDRYGRVVPVTKIKVQTNIVIQLKEIESDGYKAVQLASGNKKTATKPLKGRIKKAGLGTIPRVLREVEFDGDINIGQKITVDQVFKKGNLVDITSVSKGKGFTGVVKRWGFHGGPRTHGQSDRERAPGSIGAGTTPGRVFKGLKMAGHVGSSQVTVRGLEVIELLQDENEIWVKGSVPGARETYLLVKKSKMKKKAHHEPETPEVSVGVKQAKDEKENGSTPTNENAEAAEYSTETAAPNKSEDKEK